MRRLLRRMLLSALVLVAALAALGGVLLYTGAGLSVAVGLARPYLPAAVEVASVEGRLAGPLELRGLRYEDAGVSVAVDEVSLAWRLPALLAGELHVRRLELAGVSVALASTTEDPATPQGGETGFALPAAPLRVRADRLAASDVAVTVAGGTRTVQRAALSALWDASGLAITDLSIEAEEGSVSGHARLGAAPPHALAAGLRWRMQLPGSPAVAGTARASGDLDAVELTASLSEPAVATVAARIEEPSAALRWRARLDLRALDGALFGAPQLGRMAAQVEATGSADRLEADGRLAAPALLSSPLVVTAATDLALSDARLTVSWTDLSSPLLGQELVSPRGELRASGAPAAYALSVDAQLEAQAAPPARLRLEGRGGPSAVAVNLDAGLLGGSLGGRAHIAWDRALSIEGTLTAAHLDPGTYWSGLDGDLGFEAPLLVQLGDAGLEVEAALVDLRGTLREEAVAGAADLRYDADGLQIRALRLSAGAATAQVSGSMDDELALAWRLAAPDLGRLTTRLGGELRSEGELSGTLRRPTVRGYLSGTGLVAGDRDVGDLDVEARGTAEGHSVAASLAGPLAEAALRVEGGWAKDLWEGRLTSLSLRHPTMETAWAAPAPAAISAGADGVTLERLCLARDDSSVCVAGGWSASSPWQLSGIIDALDLAQLAALAGSAAALDGTVSGTVAAAGTGTDFDARGELEVSRGWIGLGEDRLRFEGGEGAASLVDGDVEADLALRLQDNGYVRAEARSAGLVTGGGDAPLAGEVRLRLPELKLIDAAVREIEALDGRLEAELLIDGSVGAPAIDGTVRLADGAVTLSDPGIRLDPLAIEARATAQGVRFEARATSGAGDAELTGDLSWRDALAGRIRLRGADFTAVELPDLRLVASPDLEITVAGRRVDVEGTVTVPEATLAPIALGGGIGPSADQVIVGDESEAEPEPAWLSGARVRLVLGDDVQLRAYGLSGRLEGSLLALDEPDELTTAVGSIAVVDGVYRAFGQELSIERGRLEFTGGPITQPGVDVVAVRNTSTVRAGVQVRGALAEPEITLFSEPDLPQSEIASYLFTGRSIADLTASEQASVNEAATRLALRGGSLLASQIGRRFGIDSVQLEDEGTTASTALVIGKYLSPRLFVSYGVGLFESISLVRLRYSITERWSIETESGTATSADLLYSIER